MTARETGSIEGRTVIVTGAANGIGRALALDFLGDGAHAVAAEGDAAPEAVYPTALQRAPLPTGGGPRFGLRGRPGGYALMERSGLEKALSLT